MNNKKEKCKKKNTINQKGNKRKSKHHGERRTKKQDKDIEFSEDKTFEMRKGKTSKTTEEKIKSNK